MVYYNDIMVYYNKAKYNLAVVIHEACGKILPTRYLYSNQKRKPCAIL